MDIKQPRLALTLTSWSKWRNYAQLQSSRGWYITCMCAHQGSHKCKKSMAFRRLSRKVFNDIFTECQKFKALTNKIEQPLTHVLSNSIKDAKTDNESNSSKGIVPSVLWCLWLGSRKGIRPVKNWVVGCWHGYLSGARCRFAYGPAEATATHYLLLQ